MILSWPCNGYEPSRRLAPVAGAVALACCSIVACRSPEVDGQDPSDAADSAPEVLLAVEPSAWFEASYSLSNATRDGRSLYWTLAGTSNLLDATCKTAVPVAQAVSAAPLGDGDLALASTSNGAIVWKSGGVSGARTTRCARSVSSRWAAPVGDTKARRRRAHGIPNGIRTRVASLKGWSPRPD